MELPQTTTNHDMDHYKWWHESSQITTNHYKFTMTWITTNHKSLQITTNHDINHHEPWQKPAQSMTWITTNHHKPWHEPSWWPKKRALHKAIWLPCFLLNTRLPVLSMLASKVFTAAKQVPLVGIDLMSTGSKV